MKWLLCDTSQDSLCYFDDEWDMSQQIINKLTNH